MHEERLAIALNKAIRERVTRFDSLLAFSSGHKFKGYVSALTRAYNLHFVRSLAKLQLPTARISRKSVFAVAFRNLQFLEPR